MHSVQSVEGAVAMPVEAYGETGRGQDRAVAELIAERGHLVGLAYLCLGNYDDAQDVVHEVLARLLAKHDRVHDITAYAHRAVVNECASHARRTGRLRQLAQDMQAERRRLLSAKPDPFRRVEVLESIATLSPRRRAAIVMRYYLDWDDTEIAQALECRPGTVRSLLSRAINQLGRQLQRDQEPR